MGFTGIKAVDSSLQKTQEWLKQIEEELGFEDRDRAWAILRVALHLLRDHLPLSESIQLSAQLPMLVRGMYFEGWSANQGQNKTRHVDEFLEPVRKTLQERCQVDPEQAVRTVFGLLERSISGGEIEDIKGCLPSEFQYLWPAMT